MRRRGWRAAVLAAWLMAFAPVSAEAQQDEAQALFAEANEHLARGLRSRGRRRAAELERALNGYLGVVRLGVRTRNVIFNLGLTHQELGRPTEAFNYYSEYLRTFDLSDEDRAEGERRRESLRGEVAVVEITTEPEGADVRIDRRDLPVRGQTPLVLALPFGEHEVFLSREGYAPGEGSVTAAAGTSTALAQSLTPLPVSLQVLAPANGTLTLDGQPLTPGQATPVPPGAHVLVLTMPGAAPVERSFEVPIGGEPMVLEMNAEGPTGTPVSLAINTAAAVFLDGAQVGRGERVTLPVSPGPHQLRVEAPGFNPLVQAVMVESAPLSLRADMGRQSDNRGLNAARVTFGVLTLVSGTIWAITGIAALNAHDSFNTMLDMQAEDGSDAETLDDLADNADRWAVGADVSMALTAALAVTSIVLFVVPSGEDEASNLEILGAPAPGGGSVALRGRFGGAL